MFFTLSILDGWIPSTSKMSVYTSREMGCDAMQSITKRTQSKPWIHLNALSAAEEHKTKTSYFHDFSNASPQGMNTL